MVNIRPSKQYMAYLRRAEGFRDHIYSDKGAPATGYGSQNEAHLKEVKELLAQGKKLSPQRAQEHMEENLQIAIDEIYGKVNEEQLAKMNQGQVDTLIDVYYNVRPKSRIGTTKLINEGRFEEAILNIQKLIKGRDVREDGTLGPLHTVKGLKKRAKERLSIWNGVYPEGDAVPEGHASAFDSAEGDGSIGAGIEPDPVQLPEFWQDKDSPTGQPRQVETAPTMREVEEERENNNLFIDQDEDEFIDNAVNVAVTGQPEDEQEFIDQDEDEFIDNAVRMAIPDPSEQPISDDMKRSHALKDAEAISHYEGLTPQVVAEAEKVARERKISRADASALVQSVQYRAEKDEAVLDEIADIHPTLAMWGSDPHNFATMAQNIEEFKELDRVNNPFSDDFSNVFIEGAKIDARSAYNHIGLLLGTIDDAEGIASLEELRELRAQTQPVNFAEDIAKVQESVKSSFEEIWETAQALKKYSKVSVRDGDEFIKRRSLLALEAGESFDSIMSTVGTMLRNIQGTTLFVSQSTRQLLTSMGLGATTATIGGAVGFATPVPFGTVAGAKGGFTPGYLIGEAITTFNAKMEEEIQKNYGGDYRAFYADPEARKIAQRKAMKYSGLMTVLGFINLKLAGRNTAKAINKADSLKELAKSLTTKKGMAKISLEAGKDIGADLARDVGREGIARATPLPGVPGDEAKSVAENMFEELVVGAPASVVTTGVGTALKIKLENTRKDKQVNVLYGEYVKARDTLLKRDAFSDMRNKIKALNVDGDKLQTFVKEKVKKEKKEVHVQMEEDFEYEAEQEIEENSEEIIRNEEALKEEYEEVIETSERPSNVYLDIDAFEDFITGLEEDPIEVIEILGPEWVALYNEAREDAKPLEIPAELFGVVFQEYDGIEDTVAYDDESEYTPEVAREVIKTLEAVFPSIVSEDGTLAQIDDPDAEGPTFTTPEGDAQEGDVVMRGFVLKARRNAEQKKHYNQLKNAMTRLVKNTPGISDDLIPAFAELEYQRMRHRSAVTGIPMENLLDVVRFQSMEDMRKRMKVKDPETGQLTYKWFSVTGQVEYKTPLEMIFRISRRTAQAHTVLHELGHLWLYEMVNDWKFMSNLDEASMTPEQASYWESMKIMEDLIGTTLPDLESMASDKKRHEEWSRIHEVIAQTTEKYFLEGKFKNSQIRNLMEIFRKFLKPIADMVGVAYNQWGIFAEQITPEVERMFEGILGASNAIEDIYTPIFDEAYGDFDEDLFGDKAEEYTRLRREANEQAQGEFVAKMFHRLHNAQERMIKKNMKGFEKRADAFIEEVPSVRMVKRLKEAKRGEKISTEDFIKEYGEEALVMLPKGILSGKKRKGISVAQAASMLTKGDKQKLLAQIVEGGNTDNLREKLINEMVKKEMPQIRSEEELFQEAIEIINDDDGARRKILRLEEKALLAKVKKGITGKLILPPDVQRRASREKVRAEARSIVLRSAYQSVRPNVFLRNANKHGKAAERFYRQGDTMAALDSKQKQILHNEAYHFAKHYHQKIRKARVEEKLALKLNIKKASKNYDWRGLSVMHRTAVAFKNGERIPNIVPGDFKENSMVYNSDWIDYANGEIDRINDELQSQVNRENARAETYLSYANLLLNIKQRARAHKKINVAGKLLDLELAISEVNEGILYERDEKGELLRDEDGNYVARKAVPEKDPRKQGLARVLEEQTSDLGRLNEKLSAMYPSDLAYAESPLGRLMRNVINAEADFTAHKEDIQEMIFKKLAESNKLNKTRRSALVNVLSPLTSRAPIGSGLADSLLGTTDSHFIPSLNITVTKGEALMLLLNAGSVSNLEHLTMGGFKGLGNINEYIESMRREKGEDIDADTAEVLDNEELVDGTAPITDIADVDTSIDTSAIEKVIEELIDSGVINQADLETAQFIWDSHRDMYEGANDSFEHLNGYRYGKVEAKQLKTKYGNFRGGYFPLFGTDKHIDTDAIDQQLTTAFASTDFRSMFPHSDVSYTKQRRGYKDISLQMALVPYSFHRVAQLKYLSVPLYEFGKLAGDDSVVQTLESRERGIKNQIEDWIQSTMVQRHTGKLNSRSLEMFAKGAMQRVQTATFYGNIFSVAKQPLGLFQGAVVTGVWDTAKYAALTTVSPRKSRDFIRQKSKVMATRMDLGVKLAMQHHHDMSLNGDYIDINAKRRRAITYFGMQLAQNHTDVAIWMAAYKGAIENGATEDDAVFVADITVRKTQGSSAVSNKSGFELENSVVKMFFGMFATVPLAKYNLLLESRRRNMDKPALLRYLGYARIATLAALAPSIMATLTGLAYGKLTGKEEEDEKIVAMALVDLARELGDFISPAIAPFVIQFFAGFMDIGKGSGIRTSPFGSLLSSTAKKLWSIPVEPVEFLRGDLELSAREWAGIANAATLATGMPFSLPGKIAEGLDARTSEDSRIEAKYRRSAQRRELKEKNE